MNMNMNRMKYLALALVGSMFVLSCGGGGGDDEPEPTPKPPTTNTSGKKSTQSCEMPALASETTVMLSGLSSAISSSSGSASWVTVSRETYTSGAPTVKVTTIDNLKDESRQQEFTFIAARDTVVLTVRQKALTGSDGGSVNNSTNVPSDQPAFSRHTTR
jgi:hypothetical protein